MIDKVDGLLKELLQSDLAKSFGSVEIAIDAPTRKWAEGVNGPTLNLYLHDLRENHKLRGQHPALRVEKHGLQATLQRQPLLVDLHYMVTAWAKQPHEEHQLLMAALLALVRCETPLADQATDPEQVDWVTNPPASRLDQLRLQYEIADGLALKVAQYEMHINPRDIWSVLDNEMRPAIDLMVTLAVQPFAPMPRKLVREVETRYQRWVAKEAERDGTR